MLACAHGELVHLANWRIWQTGIWRTGSYGELTMANQLMANWHMAKRRSIVK